MMLSRYRRILWFFSRVLLSLIVWELILPNLGLRRLARSTRRERLATIAKRYRQLAIQMGGVLIKVGQFLSARVDVLPDEVTAELSGLQDEVPPEKFSDIRTEIEAAFGRPLEDLFLSFNPEPVAAASLGQVHSATLSSAMIAEVESGPASGPVKIFNTTVEPEGSHETIYQVVVKVQRPQIERIIHTDMAAIRRVGGWLHRYPPIRKRANVPALLNDFADTLEQEIDYIAEGHNAETFAEMFADNPKVYVPKVYWSHTRLRVLTLEDVRAIKITDYADIEAAGVNRSEVAHRLLRVYLKQIFEDGFFHADPHPGNLFVAPLPEKVHEVAESTDGAGAEQDRKSNPWILTFVDFGMVGQVPPRLRDGMRELIIGIGTQNADRLVKSYQMMGILLPGADIPLLIQAENQVMQAFWGKSMSELQHLDRHEMAQMAHEFRDLLYDMPFQIPEDLILMGRAIGILAGICTGLDPEFNIWEDIAPYAQKLIGEEAGPGLEAFFKAVVEWGRTAVALPGKLEKFLDKAERGEMVVRDPHLEVSVNRLARAVSRAAGSLIFIALLLAGVQFYLAGFTFGGWAFFSVAALTLLWVLLTGLRAS